MVTQDVGIYFPGEVTNYFHHHIRNAAGPIAQTWSYYKQIKDLRDSQHARKIACFQIPYPFDDQIEKDIYELYDAVDAILIMGSELHEVTVSFMRRFDRPKIQWFVCGRVNPPLKHSQIYYFLDWFTTTTHFYKHVRPTILYGLKPYEPKPLVFDALLGRKKLHRDRAYNFINREGLDNQGIVTYMDIADQGFVATQSKQWIWEDAGMTGQERVEWTVDRVDYYGYNMSLSQVMPLQVYNQTAFSLVCETNCDQDYVFFTEKTVKPILARRLFVMVANRYSLAALRELGFQTFGSIIDESYDEIEGIYNRQMAAMEQIKWLCQQDQSSILGRCRDIVDHNFNLMYGTDWYARFKEQFVKGLIGR